jgi:hypothetical protein
MKPAIFFTLVIVLMILLILSVTGMLYGMDAKNWAVFSASFILLCAVMGFALFLSRPQR